MKIRLLLVLLVCALCAGPAGAQGDPDARDRAYREGVEAMRKGSWGAAEMALSTALDNGCNKWRAYLMRGYARYRLGREGALEDLGVVAERHPELAYVWAAQAMTVDQLNRFDLEGRRRAITLMDVAVARDPAVAIYYALRGRLKVGANRFKDAMADFEAALKLAPDDVSIIRTRYRALLEWGGHEAEAERDLQRLKTLDPDGKAPDPDLPPPPLPET